MMGFYSSIIFLGIFIVVAAVIYILWDGRRASNYEKRMDKKKGELVEVINDADQVLQELNKFSEYLVEQVDLKNRELNDTLERVSNEMVVVKKAVNGNDQTALKLKERVKQADHEKSEKVIPINNKYTAVIEMARKGVSKQDIAKIMNIGKGEIDLILDIRKGE